MIRQSWAHSFKRPDLSYPFLSGRLFSFRWGESFISPRLLIFNLYVFEKTEFLDKELLTITGKQKKGIVDVLAKVFLKNGLQEYILFHIEVQGYKDNHFSERMFLYFIRIWDRYRKPVSSLAILTPSAKSDNISNVFEINCFGTSIRYEYNLFRFNELQYENCISSKNPVLVAAGILAPGSVKPKWKKKYEVFRKLLEMGLSGKEIHVLISYVDRLSPLKPKDRIKFEKIIHSEESKTSMIMTSFEETAMEKGIERGKIDTAEKMIEKGMSNADIRDITGLSIEKIIGIRKLLGEK